MKKVLLIAPGGLPLPAVSGGAVQNLVEHIIAQSQGDSRIQLNVITPLDDKARQVALNKYSGTRFFWVKIPKVVEWLDLLTYHIVKIIFKKTKAISFKNNFKLLYFAYKTAGVLRKNTFDRVVIENNIRNFLALKLFGNEKKYTGKYYFHLHNIPRTNFGCKETIQNSKRILCVSEYVASCICSKNNPIGPIHAEKIFVYKNCIDTTLFCTDDLDEEEKRRWREQLGIADGEKIILFAGRLSKEKGILETIQAFAKLQMDNVKLLVVGADFYGLKTTSPFEDRLQKEAAQIHDRIIFTGYIPYECMPQIYKIADVAVLPSIWDEPAGLTMVEAMACGLPVITTNAGGIPEYTDRCSSVVLSRDEKLVDLLQEWMNKLLQDDELRSSLGSRAAVTAAVYNKERYYADFFAALELEEENYEEN